MGSAIEKTASDNYKNCNFRDVEIYSSLGITQEDIAKLLTSDRIEDAEGVYTSQGMMSSAGKVSSVTLWSETERINIPVLRSGVMPTEADECALDVPLAENLGISVGDKVHIYASGSPAGFLRCEEFTVTGLMVHPGSISGSSANNVELPRAAFDAEKTEDAFSGVLTVFDIPEDIGIFSDGYLSEADIYIAETEPLLDEIAKKRTEEIRAKYESEYDDAKKEADEKLADAKQKFALFHAYPE